MIPRKPPIVKKLKISKRIKREINEEVKRLIHNDSYLTVSSGKVEK